MTGPLEGRRCGDKGEVRKGRQQTVPETLTERIIEGIIRVHSTLGPGFLEGVYRNALVLEFVDKGLKVEPEKTTNVYYKGRPVGTHRLDMLVEGQVVVELKTVEKLTAAHYAQIRSYLKAAGLTGGLLVNFATEKADFRRVES